MNARVQTSTPLLTVALLSLLIAGCQDLLMGNTEPEWNAVANHPDGRQFVTDGKIAIDVSVAELEELPTGRGSIDWFEPSMRANGFAERRVLFGLLDLRAHDNPDLIAGPATLVLEKYQVDYLRGKFSGSQVGFWQLRQNDPLVILVDERAVGAVRV